MWNLRIPVSRHAKALQTIMSRTKSASAEMSPPRSTFELENPGILFSGAKIGSFFQDKPQLENQYAGDRLLKSYLKRHVPPEVMTEIEPDLQRFGHRVATEIDELSVQCEREQPQLQHFDAWGKRVDKILTSTAWKRQHDISAEEGLIAIAYEKQFGEWSRLYQIAKLYLYAPSSGLYSCPLAMTDGAAKIVEQIHTKYPWLKERAFPHLLSRDPSQFWTSGQWMTERKGGSDVANGTETVAVAQDDGSYKLYGYKWFSSATDSDMTFTLARVADRNGSTIEGTKGLSLYYMETRKVDGELNHIQVQKLKNKLGTRQLPTAELLLDGSVAYKVSEDGRGVADISQMLTISRIHTTLFAVTNIRRIINLARDYSTRRTAFGHILKNYPLHVQTLARMEVEARGATILLLELGRLLGRDDTGKATEHEKLLMRLLTPLAKLYTGKQAMSVVSEGLESFGGQGYIEDTGLPVLLRDSQVLTIWEGTTNVLSLDVLRAVAKTQGKVLQAFQTDINQKLAAAMEHEELRPCAMKIKSSAETLIKFTTMNQDKMMTAARDFSYSLARTYIAALLLDHAVACCQQKTDVYVAKRWCEKDLCPVDTNLQSGHFSPDNMDAEFQCVFEDYTLSSRL